MNVTGRLVDVVLSRRANIVWYQQHCFLRHTVLYRSFYVPLVVRRLKSTIDTWLLIGNIFAVQVSRTKWQTDNQVAWPRIWRTLSLRPAKMSKLCLRSTACTFKRTLFVVFTRTVSHSTTAVIVFVLCLMCTPTSPGELSRKISVGRDTNFGGIIHAAIATTSLHGFI